MAGLTTTLKVAMSRLRCRESVLMKRAVACRVERTEALDDRARASTSIAAFVVNIRRQQERSLLRRVRGLLL
jgi:hypothetical protein